MNSVGDVLWKKYLGGSSYDSPSTVIQSADGGYVVAGFSQSSDIDLSFNRGLWDAWIVKLFPDNTLPVTLNSFTAQQQNSNAALHWSTASEHNNKGFSVQHSTDGTNWNSIDFVDTKAANGNSSTTLNYTYTHTTPAAGKNYYRLQQVDIDGKYEYTSVAVVDFKTTAAITVYPNPATDKVILQGVKSGAVVKLYDSNGRLLHTQKTNTVNAAIDLARYAAGLYVIQIQNSENEKASVFRIVKE